MSRTVNRFLSRFVLASAICAVLLPLILAASTSSSQGGVTVQLNKTDSPDPVNASGILNYTITVYMIVNQSNISNISNLVLTDTYPTNVIFQTAQPTPLAGTNNTFILGNFTANQTVLVNISVLVRNVSNGTVINNTANISYQNSTGTQLNLSVTENTTVLNPPLFNFSNISVTKTDSPDPVNTSTNLTYVITVTATGNGTSYNVTVNDTYPAQVIFLSSQPTAVSGTNNTFILGNLTNGTSILINITVLTLNVSNNTIINNSVNVTFQNETSALLSRTASASTTVVNLSFPPPVPAGQGGGSSGGGGGGVLRTRSMTGDTMLITLALNEHVSFPIKTTMHTLTLQRITQLQNQVQVRVASTPQDVTLDKGVSREVDVDQDGKMDLRITVTDMTYFRATFRIEKLGAAATGVCFESWACEAWSSCAAGKQSRECADARACGTTTLKPVTAQDCVMPVLAPEPKPLAPPARERERAEPVPLVVEEQKSLQPVFYGIVLLALIVLGAYWYSQRRRKK